MAFGNNAEMLATEQAMQAKKFRLSVKITATVLIVAAVAGLFEATARVIFAYREQIQSNPFISGILQQSLLLDPYEMPSPNGPYHWVLRPGYKATQKELVVGKKKAGRDLGAGVLQAGINSQDGNAKILFRINADGFKGPELDSSHARPRILALGDSTTFGIGIYDYPRRLEAALEEQGIPVEVLNAGVEGYSPRHLLYEIERYKSLKPEIVTLYIGWNALFSSVPWPDAWENTLRMVWLFERAGQTLRVMYGDPHAFAMRMSNRDLKPVPDSPEVKALKAFTPPFIDKIEKIIDQFESIGSRVVLVTLPGLFSMSVNPLPRALEIGHLPYYTENPYVLAMLTERYNATLRDLAARRGLGIIDLEKWSDGILKPREAFFTDSVHLNERGLEMVGVYMADWFATRLKKTAKRMTPWPKT